MYETSRTYLQVSGFNDRPRTLLLFSNCTGKYQSCWNARLKVLISAKFLRMKKIHLIIQILNLNIETAAANCRKS